MTSKKDDSKDFELAKKENLKRFTKKELEDFKNQLLEMRKKIVGDIKHLEGDSLNTSSRDASGDLSGYSLHMADMATDNFDRELTIGLASNEQNLLNMIDAALRKIDEGIFGICEKTYKLITKKRLEAMPYAPLCKEAQELEEKERRRT